jgi:MFS family permease
MQNVFLVTSKAYTEKQAGVMFFVFGISQFLFQTPAGYLMDYTKKKVLLLGSSAVATTLLTLITVAFAKEEGENLGLMIFVKFLQGAVTSLIPPGLNSITQGIVGTVGMTGQVAKNEMMNHLGTAIIVLTGSLLAFTQYPDIGMLFAVSPIFCVGVVFYLMQIRPGDIDHNAARGLNETSNSTIKEADFDVSYSPPSIDGKALSQDSLRCIGEKPTSSSWSSGDSTFSVFKERKVLVFILICFTFHLANATVLPLVMQTLAIGNERTGILMSGLCVIVSQAFMVMSANICGKYSGIYGRKPLFLIGILSLPIRCGILSLLLTIKENVFDQPDPPVWLDILILCTQVFDGVGAGFFGTMYVLVTSDISIGTGRFGMTLGLTTAAMSIGGTISGYLGEALAEDISYQQAFSVLGCMSLIPALLYFVCMPETLPGALSKPMNLEEFQVEKKGEENTLA